MQHIKLDERNHVEKPLLDQLDGLDCDIIDLNNKQHPADSHRDSFTEAVMLPVLREQLKVINPWLEPGWLNDWKKSDIYKERPAKYDEHNRKNRLITMKVGIPPEADLQYRLSNNVNKMGF